MRPLVFQFKETPTGTDLDFSLIEYNHELNLSVNKITRLPAIDSIGMDTETFTKANEEDTDTDQNGIRMLADTETFTRAEGETSDADQNVVKNLMDTQTNTFTSTEQSDSDRDRMSMQILMDTSTLTESTESTDQDKDCK
jgi:hypothetical protein